MPEGHTVHRIANEFNELFRGKNMVVDSPQGRFTDAALVTGRKLLQARAIGKQLFLNFDNGLIVRVHLGIYGKWQFHKGEAPEVKGQVRARFASGNALAELRGPTVCEVIDEAAVAVVEARLGPDPLNEDASGEELNRFATRVQKSATPIGLLLMNQDVVSGIGNVYRAEILFRAGLNPHRPGNLLTKSQVKKLWDDAKFLLDWGVKHGVMITRDEFLEIDPGKDVRNWVYKREGQPCRKCGTKVTLELMASRKLYWCARCQK